MLRGLYTAASGMLSQMIATDTTADNLANISTVGFKKRGVSFQGFPEMFLSRLSGGSDSVPVGSVLSGSMVRDTAINYAPGALQQTGNPLDVSVQGDGFFNIQLPSGETGYTRAGNFTRGADGTLMTTDGYPVLGVDGPITLPANASSVVINSNGSVVADGQSLGQLKITQFENNRALQKLGYAMFVAGDEAVEKTPDGQKAGFRVVQGSLEGSNSNAVGEMVNMLMGVRLYETLQKNIHSQNETLQKAVNEVGRAKG